MKELLFHGGGLGNSQNGYTFWTRNPRRAAEYGASLHMIEIDLAQERVQEEDDFLPERGYQDAGSAEENWSIQHAAIRAAIAAGATVVLCDDGIVVVNEQRLSPLEITLEEAEEMETT